MVFIGAAVLFMIVNGGYESWKMPGFLVLLFWKTVEV